MLRSVLLFMLAAALTGCATTGISREARVAAKAQACEHGAYVVTNHHKLDAKVQLVERYELNARGRTIANPLVAYGGTRVGCREASDGRQGSYIFLVSFVGDGNSSRIIDHYDAGLRQDEVLEITIPEHINQSFPKGNTLVFSSFSYY